MKDTRTPTSQDVDRGEFYFPVDIMFLKPWTVGQFPVYVKQEEGKYLLYTAKGHDLSIERRERLFENGVRFVFIPQNFKKEYEYYLWNNLNAILTDESIPLKQRTVAWYKGSLSLVREFFEEKLPRPLLFSKFNYVKKMVQETISFFTTKDASRQALRLVSRGFQAYNHSVGTMVLTLLVLQSYGDKVDEDLLLKCAIGAIFHDVGKCRVPEAILERKPETLVDDQWDIYKSHPNLGVGLCINLPLATESLHCILFHHELDDGSGYPAGLEAEFIPFYVKALRVCEVYDGLTRATGYRPAIKPYVALQRINNYHHHYGKDCIKRLIMILVEAQVLGKDITQNKTKGNA